MKKKKFKKQNSTNGNKLETEKSNKINSFELSRIAFVLLTG